MLTKVQDEDSTSLPTSTLKHSFLNDKLQPSKVLIFSIVNSMMGPGVLLLPLQWFKAGGIESAIICILIAFVSYRTCDLTHLHAKPDESEFLSTINRIMGKGWMLIYFINSFMACLGFFVSLTDLIYSGYCNISGADCPDNDEIVWTRFSFQYMGFIVMALVAWTFFLPKLGRILDLAERGIYSIILNSLFLLYIGIKELINGNVTFTIYAPEEEINNNWAFFSNTGPSFIIGVFAMSFMIHNGIVPMIRKNQDQSKNSRDLGISYMVVCIFYLIAGTIGSMGLYNKPGVNKADTVLTKSMYAGNDTLTMVLLTANQFISAFQLSTVLPVMCHISRGQLITSIWGEKAKPPKVVFYGYSIVLIIIMLITQMFDISPNAIMSIAGTLGGFFIIYLHPIYIHLKVLYIKKKRDRGDHGLTYEERDIDIPSFLEGKLGISYTKEYIISGVLLAVGTFILIIKILALIGVKS